jgi:hypothetical protein
VRRLSTYYYAWTSKGGEVGNGKEGNERGEPNSTSMSLERVEAEPVVCRVVHVEFDCIVI